LLILDNDFLQPATLLFAISHRTNIFNDGTTFVALKAVVRYSRA
jgi:hypothetical protein